MSFIASQIISNQEKEELQKQFKRLDKSGDGKLQRDELILAYYEITKSLDLAQIEVDKILKNVDVNNSGEIDFSGRIPKNRIHNGRYDP